MSDQPISREEAEAFLETEDDSTLAFMLEKGLPLTREGYLIQAGLEPDPEEGWTAELEMQVPEIFRPDNDDDDSPAAA